MNLQNPLVSISCITYNHAPYIRQCLDGFIMQKTNFAIEVLIHDDCSTDGTTEIIKEYEAKYPDIIKPIYEDENQYQQGKPAGSVAWNFPRAKGKYIAMCEGDDYWIDPFKLQKQVDILEHNIEVGFVHTDYVIVDTNNHQIEYDELPLLYTKLKPQLSEGYIYERLFNTSSSIITCTILFRREVITSNEPISIDHSIFMSAAKRYKVAFLKDKMACYRIHSCSSMRTNYSYIQNKLFSIISAHMLNYYKNSNSEDLNLYYHNNDKLRREVDLFFSKYFTYYFKKGFLKCNLKDLAYIFINNPRLFYLTPYYIFLRLLKKC